MRIPHVGIQALSLVLLSFHPDSAWARIGEDAGFGSRLSALAGAGASWGADAYGAYNNPALLSGQARNRFSFGAGLVTIVPSFIPISGVRVSNADVYGSDVDSRLADVDTDYRDTVGQVLGLRSLVAPEWHRLSIGATAFLPLNQFAYVDSGEVFVPEYVMYRSRTQRPELDMGLALSPGASGNWHLGAGVHLGFSLNSSASVFLTTEAGKPSSMRFSASLKPKATPQIGILYQSESDTEASSFTSGLVARFPLSNEGLVFVHTGARLLGGSLDFSFPARSVLVYDPLTLQWGASIRHSENFRTLFQLDWQRWSRMKSSAEVITQPTVEDCSGPCGLDLSASANPDVRFRDIFVPRIAEEIRSGLFTYRLGYLFRPSIIRGLPTGNGNSLDPSVHSVSAGLGWNLGRWEADFHATYQRLLTQEIQKVGAEIGAPGYRAGGKILAAGVSLTYAME